MRIGFLGSRGIPACYSGFETFVEQISVRLAARGHAVTVYNRIPFNRYAARQFHGVNIVRLATIPAKATDTIIHTGLSVAHALGKGYDIAYFCGVGNALFSALPRVAGARTVVNVDGADFERAKWRGFARWWLHRSEAWAARLADAVIADNGTIQERYRRLYGVEAKFIPYGANVVTADPGAQHLARWQLQPGQYFLYVSRLTPENAADFAIEAHRASGVALPLVVVGDAPYQREYIARLHRLGAAAGKVIFTGFVFGEAYQQLSWHSRAFVLPTAIDATRPVLLDQMGFGACVIVRDTPGNVEVVGDAGLTFAHADPINTLGATLRQVAADPAAARAWGRRAQERVRCLYDWDVITTRYEELFGHLIAAPKWS